MIGASSRARRRGAERAAGARRRAVEAVFPLSAAPVPGGRLNRTSRPTLFTKGARRYTSSMAFATICFMISVVPAKIGMTRTSR